MSAPRFIDGDGHPSADLLLLNLDGELEPNEATAVEEHLKQCWSCRARAERMQRSICAFVEHRDNNVLPSLPGARPAANILVARLYRASAEQDSLPSHHRLTATFLPSALQLIFRSFNQLSRPAYISAAISIITLLALVHYVLVQPPQLQATEFLRRAVAARKRQPYGRAIAYQRVRIQRGSTVVERTTAPAAMKAAMALVNMDWETPLSAERFSNWRERLPQKTDSVIESNDSLTLRTTPTGNQANEVRYASLTVNRADWRPVAEHVEFQSQPALDVTELSFEMRELPAAVEALPAKAAVAPALPIQVDSVETEFAVRYALHKINADLDEPIDVQPGGRGSALVTVAGIAPSSERQQEIVATLRGISHVDVQLHTEEEAARAMTVPSPATRIEPLMTPTRSPIEKQLREKLGDPNTVENFTKQVINISKRMVAHAWALRRLSGRYGATGLPAELRLSPASQQLLLEMRRDHELDTSKAASELITLLRPVLDSVVQDSSEPATRLPLFDGAVEAQRLTMELLVGSGTAEENDPAKAAQDLLAALRGLEMTQEKKP